MLALGTTFADGSSELKRHSAHAIGPSPENPDRSVYLYELALGTGYVWGELRRDQGSFKVVPIFLHVGFGLNRLLGFGDHRGTLQFALEPFFNPIVEPESGMELGLGIFLKYDFPLFQRLDIFAEAGIAPMYFGIDTVEQGDAGFNFLDQIGGGLRFRLPANKAVSLGYRWRHVSHAGLGNGPNTGINAHALILGLSILH